MAKKKSKGDVNKSKSVRDYLERHPDATASEVVPALAEKGIEVSGALVNNVRSVLKKQGGNSAAKKAPGGGRPKGRPGKRAARAKALTLEELREAKKLVDDLGGVAEARKALDALEELR